MAGVYNDFTVGYYISPWLCTVLMCHHGDEKIESLSLGFSLVKLTSKNGQLHVATPHSHISQGSDWR
jgi:hypothetical protein